MLDLLKALQVSLVTGIPNPNFLLCNLGDLLHCTWSSCYTVNKNLHGLVSQLAFKSLMLYPLSSSGTPDLDLKQRHIGSAEGQLPGKRCMRATRTM